MILTGRAALFALAGALVVLAFRTGLTVLIVDAVIFAAICIDLVLAASLKKLSVSRSGEVKIHLGQPGTVSVTIVNNGTRRLRGIVRDAWRPSAGAQPARSAVSVPGGRRVTVTTTLTPRRRGDAAAGPGTLRSLRP